MEGIITANGNIKIHEDGSIEVNNGKFMGEVEGSSFVTTKITEFTFTENDEDKSYRTYLEQLAEEKGVEYLHELLQKVADIRAEESCYISNATHSRPLVGNASCIHQKVLPQIHWQRKKLKDI